MLLRGNRAACKAVTHHPLQWSQAHQSKSEGQLTNLLLKTYFPGITVLGRWEKLLKNKIYRRQLKSASHSSVRKQTPGNKASLINICCRFNNVY